VKIAGHEWRQLFVLLDGFLELPDAGRPAFLSQLAHESPHLKGIFDSLIVNGLDAEGPDLAQLPPIDAAVLAASKRFKQSDGLAERTEVGPYRLIREIGRGGTSSVWLAVRSDGQMRPIAEGAQGEIAVITKLRRCRAGRPNRRVIKR
jgi:hypothetical protein